MNRTAAIRRVIAEYGNVSQGGNREQETVPWMDYVEKATEVPAGTSETYQKLLSLAKKNPATTTDYKGGDPQVGPSLIDGVTDGLSVSKTQEAPPANENDSFRSDGDMMSPPSEFNRTSIKEEPGQSRDNYFKSLRDRPGEEGGNPWGSNLYGDNTNLSNLEASVKKQAVLKTAAKKLNDILDASTHPKTEKFKDNGKRVVPTLAPSTEGSRQGLFNFRVPSEKGKPPYNVTVQFMKPETPVSSLFEHPAMVACDCPAFLYWGPQYYAMKGDYMYTPEFRPKYMSPRNPEIGGRGAGLTFCKHLYAVATHLSALGIDPQKSDETEDEIHKVISDPTLLNLPDVQEIEDRADLMHFISDPSTHSEFRAQALKDLQASGLSEHELINFVNGPMLKMNDAEAKTFIEGMADATATLLLLLIEYKKIKGNVPSSIMGPAFAALRASLFDAPDQEATKNIEQKVKTVGPPPAAVEALPEIEEVDTIEEFRNLLHNPEQSTEVYQDLLAQLSEVGITEDSLKKLVTGRVSKMEDQEAITFIESMAGSPGALLAILILYSNIVGPLPEFMVRSSFGILKDSLFE